MQEKKGIKKVYESYFDRKKGKEYVHDYSDVVAFAKHYHELMLKQEKSKPITDITPSFKGNAYGIFKSKLSNAVVMRTPDGLGYGFLSDDVHSFKPIDNWDFSNWNEWEDCSLEYFFEKLIKLANLKGFRDGDFQCLDKPNKTHNSFFARYKFIYSIGLYRVGIDDYCDLIMDNRGNWTECKPKNK